MRNSPDGQILGHPNPGIPRRTWWGLVALVVLAHAALLFDLSSGIGNTTSTSVLPNAWLAPLPPGTTAESATHTQRVSAVRWVASPPPPPKPPTPAPKAQAKPKPTAPVPEAKPAEPTHTPTPSQSSLQAHEEAAPTTPNQPLDPIPVPSTRTRLVYDITGQVRGLPVFAEGLFEWTVQDGRYDASLAVRMALLGTRTQTSVGRIGPQGLVPERFGERQRDEAATHFDYEGQRIRFSRNRPDAPLIPGTQDRLSVILQLAAHLQAQPMQTGQSMAIPVASSREVDLWTWSIGEATTVDLPQGPVLARHLIRPALHERDNTIELWLAPSLQHLPVRIRITQSNGDWLDQRLVLAP
jgi:hypothetical protein